MKTSIWAVAAYALGLGAAHAGYYNHAVAANSHYTALRYATLTPACTSMGYANVRLTQAPSHGRVVISQGREYTFYPPSNPRAVCNSHKVPAVLVVYWPEKGFVGSDSFSVEAITVTGGDLQDTVNVSVK